MSEFETTVAPSSATSSLQSDRYDAVIVGAGPNGLTAAIALARAGRSVAVIEAAEEIGGGARTAELTLPGFHHDVCSAIQPLGAASPYWEQLPLEQHGLRWIHPERPLAHPLDDGPAVFQHRSIEATRASMGDEERGYAHVMRFMQRHWADLKGEILGPTIRVPRHPITMARFGLMALQSARGFSERHLETERARALMAGLAAHSFLPLNQRSSVAIGLVLGAAAHTVGWPLPAGGSASIIAALASYLRSLGGEIASGWPVHSIEELPRAKAYVLNVTPRQLLRIAGRHLPTHERRRLGRFRYGPGVFKVDWALSAPVPWRDPEVALAGTVHLGGTLEEIAESERTMASGRHAERPFVLIAQQSLFDPSRAPEGKHTLWGYCHVPSGSTVDMTEAIEAQIERFAPGFRDCVLARHTMNCRDYEHYNANYIGGDINGGAANLAQILFRPTRRWTPYATANPRIFLCSSSTPPGGGVHGMCGYHAAQTVLERWDDLEKD